MTPSHAEMVRSPLTWPYRLAMSVIIAGALTFGALMGYVFWPYPVVYIDTPIRVMPLKVKAGDWIKLQVFYSKPFNYTALVGFMLASKGNIALSPAALSSLPPGDHHVNLWYRVPEQMPPDTYVVQLIVEHPVRLPMPALFDRPVVAATEPFQVIE